MCWKYGKRLILSPINEEEQRIWKLVGGNMKLFRFIHKWFIKG